MSHRIDIELTSANDGVWTWRAAGARQPKGTLDPGTLYEGARVGDVVRAEAERELVDQAEQVPAEEADLRTERAVHAITDTGEAARL